MLLPNSETTSVFIVPSDDDNLTVYAATQHHSLSMKI